MAITTRTGEGADTRITIEGPMTVYEAIEHKRELLEALAAGAGLEIDLANVDEMDTAGLQLLVLAQREGRNAGKPVRLVRASEAVAEVLNRYRLAPCFIDPAAPRA